MTDFSHLKKLDISPDKTEEYTLFQLNGSPKLICAPATADNKPFFNETLKKAKAGRVSQKNLNAEVVAKNREDDKEIIARHIIKGWTGIKDKAGKVVPFSQEAALDFLKALPDWIFDDFRNWVQNADNFVSYGEESEEVTKNS